MQHRETWQEKLTRLENEFSRAKKRKSDISTQKKNASEVKRLARETLEEFEDQVRHPLNQNLYNILPSELIEICKDYSGFGICARCKDVYDSSTGCIFEEGFQLVIKMCKEDAKLFIQTPNLHTLLFVLRSHHEHAVATSQIESAIAQCVSRGWSIDTRVVNHAVECDLNPDLHTGTFIIDFGSTGIHVFANRYRLLSSLIFSWKPV